jgi:predicted HicB family RNase H-like nuclease
MAKKDHITMRVDEELHNYLKSMAKRENRPLSNMIYTLLTKAVADDRAARYKAAR